jgi:hypothetical protein
VARQDQRSDKTGHRGQRLLMPGGLRSVQTTTARELYDEMLKLYPDWINRGALSSASNAIF